MTTKTSKQALAELQKQIKISFTDPGLLERAFIHRSYLNEHPKLGLELMSAWSSWVMLS